MPRRSSAYDGLKKIGPRDTHPLATVLLRYWEHCENVHGATPEDFGTNVQRWHKDNHPECALPSFVDARRVDWVEDLSVYGQQKKSLVRRFLRTSRQ